MSLARSIRVTLKYVFQFIAGFASVSTFAFGKSNKISSAEPEYTLEKDRFEIASDSTRATFKLKQNERK